ncbi:MAG TPA: prolyl oligopeptidase family serine peptidase [Candidatus Polarisedimenticolaceae bacterium]|nr:prolyl oligopeptidase family serine peptidase [Candidatus Polarisedimenticolaceae bacterium]
MRKLQPALLTILLAAPLAAAPKEDLKLDYPDTKKVEVVDDYHGTKVEDPYRWLEQDARESTDVQRWIEAENEVTFDYLERIPERKAIENRLTELWDYERYSSPFKVGGRYYYAHNSGLQNQSVVYTQDNLDAEARVLLDPNTWSEDGTVALAGLSFSDDGNFMAYAKSVAGSDWQRWYVRDLRTDQDLADELQWTKFTNAAWTPDGRGFFYSRFDAPPPGEEYKALNTDQKVFYHRVGTPQSEDVLVFHRPDQPKWGYGSQVTDDGHYLVISVYEGTDNRNRVFYKDLFEPYGMPVALIPQIDNEYSFLGNDGPIFYFRTDLDAPKGRVIAIDTRRPEPASFRQIIPEADGPLGNVSLKGNMFVVSYLEDVVGRVRVFRTDGTHVRDVELPGKGSVGGFGGQRNDLDTFYTYTSFNTPPTIYRYDLVTGASTLWRKPDLKFDPDAYVVKQVFYQSKDGTKIPMFITHRKGIELDGNRPTLLYGYGGFSISLTPSFSVTRLAWMEMGGVYAVANLRGGGEYGEEWHDAGRLHNKQNVFDDFIAAAEWLIDNDYTSAEKLAIMGGSNGGLLVGACMTQRPDLFAVAIPAVGVMDMLRYNQFTAGRYWVDDYGNPSEPEYFKTLLAYSPYHNIKPGTSYPATLITTADTDDRVVPAHSFKFAARLQEAHRGDAPVLIRIETRAGHGGGKPTTKQIEETADVYAFLVENLYEESPVIESRTE